MRVLLVAQLLRKLIDFSRLAVQLIQMAAFQSSSFAVILLSDAEIPEEFLPMLSFQLLEGGFHLAELLAFLQRKVYLLLVC